MPKNWRNKLCVAKNFALVKKGNWEVHIHVRLHIDLGFILAGKVSV